MTHVRLYVGGLAADVTAEDLVQRFKIFGDVQAAEVLPPKVNDTFRDAKSNCRGFGYITVQFKDDSALRKCLTVYNGSKWKGGVLKLQPAKPTYKEKMKDEAEAEVLEQIERQQEAALKQELESQLFTTFVDQPLTLISPLKKEFKTKSNSKRDYFPVSKAKPLCDLDWDIDRPHNDFESRKREFASRNAEVFDAEKARKEWQQDLKKKRKNVEEEEEPQAVSFLTADDIQITKKEVDLSRFSDDSD